MCASTLTEVARHAAPELPARRPERQHVSRLAPSARCLTPRHPQAALLSLPPTAQPLAGHQSLWLGCWLRVFIIQSHPDNQAPHLLLPRVVRLGVQRTVLLQHGQLRRRKARPLDIDDLHAMRLARRLQSPTTLQQCLEPWGPCSG